MGPPLRRRAHCRTRPERPSPRGGNQRSERHPKQARPPSREPLPTGSGRRTVTSVSTTADTRLPFFLRGNYAPVADEIIADNLTVTGAVPPELRGRFIRNGPNPSSGASPHWFLGDGMLHGVELGDGDARWYRNRYVRTRSLAGEGTYVDDQGR